MSQFLDTLFPPSQATWEELGLAFVFLIGIWLLSRLIIRLDKRNEVTRDR